MTKNREVFQTDPTTTSIPNEGVAKVTEPQSEQEWAVLRYELQSFVCEGEYRLGLERILDTFLTHVDKYEQPAVWVSGFYGSGKSHLVRVLEYLWRDVQFPDGATARGITNLPREIQDQFKALTIQGRRAGGLWSAAGTLGAGSARSVRLAFLGILLRSARLPDQYAPARFVMWLKQNDYYDAVSSGVEARGKEFSKELNNLYVSPFLAESLLAAYPGFAASSAEARSLLRAQFPVKDDITDDELLLAMEDVLALQSSTRGRQPLTLLVFDELQQFIGDDGGRALAVQNIVEACSSRFGSKLLFVGTGQAALQATGVLQKLQGRFTVRVTLRDTDVEEVVRQVVLRKRPEKQTELKAVLDNARGEIDRHLAGTRIGPKPEDVADLVPDYPLLPVRRRFWENVLRGVDPSGTGGQLRTQLRIVHEAARAVADRSLGTVVAGDYIYDQLRSDMLQSSVLLRDVDAAISTLAQEGEDGVLKARLCALVFLIGKLPTQGVAATGVLATAATLADLMVVDLPAGSAALRQRIPGLLQDLVDKGTLMVVGDEYRLQTRESADWEADFRKNFARIQADDSRIASDRTTGLRNVVGEALRGKTFTQGVNKTPRKFDPLFGLEQPEVDTVAVPVWIRDEWQVSEKTVREDAQREGVESPIVFVFLPRQNADALKAALASQAAAEETLNARPRGTTPESIEARSAMEARLKIEQNRVKGLLTSLVNAARVYQGGGIEVNEGTFVNSVEAAVQSALVRLFPAFEDTNQPGWDKVFERATQGAADPLTAVGYPGDIDKHTAARKVRDYLGRDGKRGNDVRKQFMGPGYGWPQDAVDGLLMALMAGGFVRATNKGQPVNARTLGRAQIGVTDFFSEGITITAQQRIGVRGAITKMGLPVKAGEELAAMAEVLRRLTDLAGQAGGASPLPAPPSTANIEELSALSGNEQFAAFYDRRDELAANHAAWTRLRTLIAERWPRWQFLERLLSQADGLPVAQSLSGPVRAIQTDRSLLGNPDPVPPLLAQLTAGLRSALMEGRARLAEVQERELGVLEATEEWQALSQSDQSAILAANGIGPVPEPSVGTDEALLESLAAIPLREWESRLAALPGRVARAREEAARRLAPAAVTLQPPHGTLRSADEVDAYLAELRKTIMQHIDAGKPVIL
ncbi:MAG: BREX system P-loop protein BrxC [Anaerolineales bacterium]|nr:BREX system P-loop protein BrxC [Anaerolineales bacterium]